MNSRKKRKLAKSALVAALLLVAAVFLYVWRPPSWWVFPTEGIIQSRPSVFGGTLFVGNAKGNLRAINVRTGKERWGVQLTEGINSPAQYYRGTVYTATVDGVLYANNASTGKERWRYEAGAGYVFETLPIITPPLLFVGDSRGILHAVDKTTGKRAWTFSQQNVASDKVDRSNNPNWFGQLLFYKDRIIVGGADGIIYSIQPKTGRVLWKYSIGEALSALEANGDLIVAVTKSGEINALSTSGQSRWSASGGKRASYILYVKREHPLTIIGQMLPTNVVPDRAARLYLSVITVTKDGEIVSRDIRNGKIFYTVSRGSEVTTFPTFWSRFIYFGDSNNKLVKLDGLDGKEEWSYKTEDKIRARPLVAYRNFPMKYVCDRWGRFYWVSRSCLVTVFVGDNSGNLEAIRANSGNPIWKFRASGPIASTPVVVDGRLLLGSQDGNIYTVASVNGKITKPWMWRRIDLSQNTSTVSENDILELTISYPDMIYPRPWKDIVVRTQFVHSSGKTVTIDGYYYDKDTWKVKFNPTDEGKWNYIVTFGLPDDVIKRPGSFVSQKTSKKSYLRLHNIAGEKRLSADGVSLFPIIGIGDVIDDANCNGNLLDDFFVGDGENSPAKDIYNKHCNGLNTFTNEEYFSQYSGFNTFRWSVNNASFNLWKHTDPPQNRYQIFEGKAGDRLAESVVNHNMKLWMTLYSWDLPNEYFLRGSPVYMHMIKQYIRYVVARYGAYVSIWELNNEAHTATEITDELAVFIKSLDYESRPVTTSWEQPRAPAIDMVSLHWYANEPLGTSDVQLVGQTRPFEQYGKPVVFSEQGNKKANWDEYSATRMRVRAWTAALNNIGIIFWNTSHRKDYAPPEHLNGNLFIGEEERSYVRALTAFLKDIDIDAKPFYVQAASPAVRSYGLSSERVRVVYFHRFSDYGSIQTIRVPFFLPRSGTLVWYDTKTGETLVKTRVVGGNQVFVSPPFVVDVALKVVFD